MSSYDHYEIRKLMCSESENKDEIFYTGVEPVEPETLYVDYDGNYEPQRHVSTCFHLQERHTCFDDYVKGQDYRIVYRFYKYNKSEFSETFETKECAERFLDNMTYSRSQFLEINTKGNYDGRQTTMLVFPYRVFKVEYDPLNKGYIYC